MALNAAERVRHRVLVWLDDHHEEIKEYEFSAAVGKSANWVSNIKNDPIRRSFTLRDLDRIAEVMGVLPSQLVMIEETEPWELRPAERLLVRFFRSLPEAVQTAVMVMVSELIRRRPL